MSDVHVCPRRRGENQHTVGRKFAQLGTSQDRLRARPIGGLNRARSQGGTHYAVNETAVAAKFVIPSAVQQGIASRAGPIKGVGAVDAVLF